MSAWIFSGLTTVVYPESRDANGRLLGTVDPGDIRFFDDGPPDSLMWTPANGDGTAAEDGESEPAASQGEDSGAAEGDAPASSRTRRSQPAEPAA